MERPDKGIEILEQIVPSDTLTAHRVQISLIWLYHMAKRFAEAKALITKMRASRKLDASSIGIEGLIAYEEGDEQYAKACANEALQLDKSTVLALKVLRLLHGESAPGAMSYKVQIHGFMELTSKRGVRERYGFFTTYWVKADSPESALDFIRQLEPEALEPLTVERFTPEEDEIKGPDGVYGVQLGYTFYKAIGSA